MFKYLLFLTGLVVCMNTLPAQTLPFNLTLEEMSVPNMPALQSFAWAQHDGKWLLIGGRTDGLHRRQPFAAFDPDFNNTNIYVVDPANWQVMAAPVGNFTASLKEQLQSTNMQFYQDGDILYLIGGYGYSATADEFVTYPYLVSVNVPALIAAAQNGNDVAPLFVQVQDERLAVTGGNLGQIGDYFYLVGGQRFDGRYNPMGPDHGPGFTQIYTDEVRRFRIVNNNGVPALSDYSAWHDTLALHRRDYNLAAQVFPDGSMGYTAFSGVFRHNANLPWLNTVDVHADNFAVKEGFEQLLNAYHGAHIPLYDATTQIMHTVFTGGIGQFYFDPNGQLINDYDVPFVKTISCVTRLANGFMQECHLPVEMPGYLGASAWFIPATDVPQYDNGVLKLDELPSSPTPIGYIVGGIESSGKNIFWINTGTESNASKRVFKVFLEKNTTSTKPVNSASYFDLLVYPNPAKDFITIEFSTVKTEHITLELYNSEGRRAATLIDGKVAPGRHSFRYAIGFLEEGTYIVQVSNGKYAFATEIAK